MTDNEQTPMQKMMGDFAPTFVSLTDDVLFDQVWSRPELSRRDRSLATISSLVSAGNIEQLEAHIPMGIANGLTKDEISKPSPTSRSTPAGRARSPHSPSPSASSPNSTG